MSSTLETEKEVQVQQLPPPGRSYSCMAADVGLRVTLLVASIVAVVVMVTSKETELVPVPTIPGPIVPRPAKFNHSPALIYLVAALSFAGLYSIITIITSLSAINKPNVSPKYLFTLALFDVLMLGIVASATGTAGGVAYIGLKGNKHVLWGKICSVYGKFYRHIGGSIAVSLFASGVLILLIFLNVYTLYRRTPAC